jgi:hypothetical protein
MPGTLPGSTTYGHRVQLKYADGVQLGRADRRALKAPRKSRTRSHWRCASAAVLVGAFGAWVGAASASVEPFSAHLSRRAGDPPRWALVFTNQRHTVTRYSVCVERSSHADRRCWSRTVAVHRTSRVIIGAYPPGSWLAEWTSAGRRISRQFVVEGDELESLLRRVPLAKAKGILSQHASPFLAEVRAQGEREEVDGEKRRGPFQWGVSQPSCSTETKPEAEIVCQETAELQYNAVGHSATPVNVCETKPGYYSPTECPVLEYPEVLSPAGEEHRVSLVISGSGVFDPLHPEAGRALCAHLEAAVHHEPRSTREWELLGASGPTCNVTV